MMKIKFRCYDKNEKYMLPWEHLVDAGDLSEMLKFGHEEDADYSKLMQYTGLKDKNGVEIYEGDIVKVADSKEKFRNIIEQIKFSRGSFDLDDTELWRLEDDYNSGKIFYEVIGNIYENPELLETKK